MVLIRFSSRHTNTIFFYSSITRVLKNSKGKIHPKSNYKFQFFLNCLLPEEEKEKETGLGGISLHDAISFCCLIDLFHGRFLVIIVVAVKRWQILHVVIIAIIVVINR